MPDYILSTYARINLEFSHGRGSWLYTKDNKKYLDFAAGIAVNLLGHANPFLIKALTEQAHKVWHTSNLYKIKEQEKLAGMLCKNSFANKVFFCNSGAEATDGLVKIIRKYHYSRGDKNKTKIIVFDNAFHGRTLTGILAGSTESHREGFLPYSKTNGGFIRVKFQSINEVKKAINSKVAGIFIEPIQGEGGINVANIKFLSQLRKVCNENKILLGFDEVQSGIGRTGKMFAYQWSKIKPDILTSAKGLGGGFPIGAILLSNKIAKAIKPGAHGSTFGGNHLACAVGQSVISQIAKKSFLKNVTHKGELLAKGLEEIRVVHNTKINSIHGKGLMLGMNCKISNLKLNEEVRHRGLLLVPAANNILRILPPLNVTIKEIKKALEIINNSLKEIN
ncbi:MAG: acetylornithine transaminase [Rickettsiales bacterium]|nr:acetylornithine transaminase [Rickettsiales bacterium]